MKTFRISYRGWVFFITATERQQGQNIWWDLVVTNNQNEDVGNFSIQAWREQDPNTGDPLDVEDLDQYLIAEYMPEVENYINNNGGTIG